MRNIPFFICLILFSCSTSQKEKPVADAPVEEPASIPKGLVLIEGNDCQTCHHAKNKLMGPSYAAIASRYEVNNETRKLLTGKIINGGNGTWGDTPMNAHPTLSEEDALEMVNYILSLK